VENKLLKMRFRMKLDRLLAMTMLLLNRKRISAKELSERFEVSLRTVYRDMDTLTLAGIPVASYAGQSGGYEIMESFRLERQYLSLEEMESMIVALKGVRTTLEDRDIGNLLDKMSALTARTGTSPESMHLSRQLVIDMNPWQTNGTEKSNLGQIREAIRQSRVLRFSYVNSQGSSTERECEPIVIVFKGFAWYLYAFCRLRQEMRVFRLSRIDQLTILEEGFEASYDPPEQLHYGLDGDGQGDRSLITLLLRFHPRAKARVYDYFQPTKVIIEPDGKLLVTSIQPDEPWLYGMLLSYGPDVTVLEPSSVAAAVRQQAEQIVRLYAEH
jgi:predicted DNA-binding transcriptional regulator YafY